MNPETSIHPNTIGIRHQGSFNVINSYNNTYADEKPQILEWLSPLEPRVRHQDVRTSRLDGLGEWLLQSDEFVNWRDGGCESDRSPLFCSGAPGVGKTYISSLVIDKLCDQSVGRGIAVACFYCDFQYQKMQTPENILGALVKQLIRGLGSIPTEIDDAFQKAKSQVGGRGLRIPELLPLLQVALAPLEKAFICIDALDECLEKHLPELLRALYTISQWSPKIRLFITGRPHIQHEVGKHFPGGAQIVEIKSMREDILKYLQMMLDNDLVPEAMNADLKAEIVTRVLENISDVFLLVSLNIAAILGEATIYDRREQLKRMTNGLGLGDAYRVALDRVETQGGAKSRLGIATLMWVSRSERPMTADELCHALGVQLGSTDHNPESVPSIQTLLVSCLGLVALDGVGSTVRLVHFTLQEYLDNNSEIFRNPYAGMAEVCLTYLNYDCVKKLSSALHYPPLVTPFLKYASKYWGPYARNETTKDVKSLALRLLRNFDGHVSARFLLQPVPRVTLELTGQPKGFTGLHCVAYLGIDEIASALLQTKDGGINGPDFSGRTPLIWAAEYGHEGIIKLFLKEKDINCNTTDAKRGRTALSWAVTGGYEEIVKLLLDRGAVDAEARDNYGRTPLSHAAESGREGVVKLLLEQEEVNAESEDMCGRTPLSYAAGSGMEGAVKLLLEREEVNAESHDNGGRTPLSYAAEGGNVGVVELFLERREVNAESEDNDGRTPLSHAAGRWDGAAVSVVEFFLERGEVDADSRDYAGRTPLSYAAECWDERVVKLFLERGEVHAGLEDDDGRTPLSYAAESGNVEAVELFLKRQDVYAETEDGDGRTPLSYAAQEGDERTLKLLLEREEVSAESLDIFYRTPLSHAAESMCEGAVELLLAQEEVNVESRDNRGRTPLSHAAGCWDERIVKLFLEWGEVDVDSQDYNGRTPLSYAAEDEKVVKLFLERREVHADLQDDYGRTPLSYAAEVGGERAVELFLEREVNANLQDDDGRTPLSYAAKSKNEKVVRLLLERGGVNADLQDDDGRTPLSYAAEGGNERTMELFLEREEVRAESQDYRGRTPLSYAAARGRAGAVKLLLALDGVNAGSGDRSGRTPLFYAAGSGAVGVVELFLEREVNADLQDDCGKTPLSYAAARGCVEIVKLFLERHVVNAESRDSSGRTPLSYAAQSGSEGVIELLLEHEAVNAGSQGNDGRTPLSYAAQSGREKVVKLLLDREEISADLQDNCGRTPLSYAAEQGSVEIVKLFLERHVANADSRDNCGRTPLSYAAQSGSERAIKLFLEQEAVNAESQGNDGRTPLSYAAQSGRKWPVKPFLDREGINADLQDNFGRTPLSYAADQRRRGAVKLLLEREDVNTVIPLFFPFGSELRQIGEMCFQRREINPRSRAPPEDETVAQLIRGPLETMPVTQHLDARTPNSCSDHSSPEAELLAHFLQLQDANHNTLQENTQNSSLTNVLIDDTYQNPGLPTKCCELDPLASPLVRPVPSTAVATRPLPPSPQRRARRFSQAFEDEPSAQFTLKRQKPS